jgi:hypothetical protein
MNLKLKSKWLKLRTKAVINDQRTTKQKEIPSQENVSREIREKWLAKIYNVLQARARYMAQEASCETQDVFG